MTNRELVHRKRIELYKYKCSDGLKVRWLYLPRKLPGDTAMHHRPCVAGSLHSTVASSSKGQIHLLVPHYLRVTGRFLSFSSLPFQRVGLFVKPPMAKYMLSFPLMEWPLATGNLLFHGIGV